MLRYRTIVWGNYLKQSLKESCNSFTRYLIKSFSINSLNIFGMCKDNGTIICKEVVNRESSLMDGIHTNRLAVSLEKSL